MRAIEIDENLSIRLADREAPRCGPGDVVVRVKACGICGTDLHLAKGAYLGRYPLVPGHEIAGVVEETGSEVGRCRPGDRVAVEPNIACGNCVSCLRNRPNLCLEWRAIGITLPGGFAERVVAPERNVFPIGDLDFETGALVEPLSCVLHGLEMAPGNAADRVLLLGLGPIGRLMRLALGLRVAVPIDVVETNRARLEALGTECRGKRISDTSEIERDAYDLVVDATGSAEVQEQTIDWVAPGGAILLFGVARPGQTFAIEPFRLFRKEISLHSSYTSRNNSHEAVRLLRRGAADWKSVVSRSLPLEDFTRGIELMERHSEGVGKIIIIP